METSTTTVETATATEQPTAKTGGKKMKGVAIFSEGKKTQSALEVFEESVELGRVKEDSKDGRHKAGDIELKFKFASNRGSAPVRLPVDMVSDFVSLLEEGPKPVQAEDSMLDVVRNSLSYETAEDGTEFVTFRTGHGKGSKIQRIPVAEYEQVVESLRAVRDKLPEAVAELKSRETEVEVAKQ